MNGEPRMPFSMLNDISKVAAIKATSALSKLLDAPIGVDVVPVETKSLEEFSNLMQPREKVVGISVPILGSLPGTCLLIYPEKSAYAMCDAMFHRKEGTTKKLTENDISALTESANIVVGNFLTSLAIPLQTNPILHRAANLDQSEFCNFMKDMSLKISKNMNDEMMVELSFYFQHIKISGMALFVFGQDKMADLIRKASA